MPLGGLLPYDNNDDDPLAGLAGLLSGATNSTFPTPGVNPMASAAPKPNAGFGQTLADILPFIVSGLGLGASLRQGDAGGISNSLDPLMQMLESKRRTKLAEEQMRRAEEMQRFREEREMRVAEDANTRARLTEEREDRVAKQAGQTAQTNFMNQTEDNLRGMATGGRSLEGPGLEDYMSAQGGQFKALGGDPNALRQLIMSVATQVSRPPAEVPLITLKPGEAAPATVPSNAVVRNAPQRPQGPQPPTPRGYTTTDEAGHTYRITEDPMTGRIIHKELVGKRPLSANDAMDAKLLELLGGASATPAPAPSTPTPAGRGAAPPSAADRTAPPPATRKVGDVVKLRDGRRVRITKLLPNGQFAYDPVQ